MACEASTAVEGIDDYRKKNQGSNACDTTRDGTLQIAFMPAVARVSEASPSGAIRQKQIRQAFVRVLCFGSLLGRGLE
jgi:hypothetical protein